MKSNRRRQSFLNLTVSDIKPEYRRLLQSCILFTPQDAVDLVSKEFKSTQANSPKGLPTKRGAFAFNPIGTEDGYHFGVGPHAATNELTVLSVNFGSGNGSAAYMGGRHPGWFMSRNSSEDKTWFGVNTGSSVEAEFVDLAGSDDGVRRIYVGRYDGANVQAYVDGVLKQEAAQPGQPSVHAKYFKSCSKELLFSTISW